MGTRIGMRELISSYTEEKRQSERFDVWLYHVGRRLSWPVAWVAINVGISATTVTFISALFVWAGALLIAVGNPVWQLIGALMFQLWIIFDCADGTIARATGTGSKRGEYADAFGGYSVSLMLYSSMGVAAARTALELDTVIPRIWEGLSGTLGPSAHSTEDVLVAGALLLSGVGASLLSLFSRLLYQKFLNIYAEHASAAEPIKPRHDRGNLAMVLAQNLAANSGFALPLSIAALASGREDVFVLAYLLINAAMLALTIRRTLTKRAAARMQSATNSAVDTGAAE
ncbi:MAG: CDP-alcohol phosphatidyltransferase family protein [Alkalispirochaeta sp.]